MAKAKKTDTTNTETPATNEPASRELRLGTIVLPWDDVPEGNRIRLAQRTVNHIAGNEAAAVIGGKRDTAYAAWRKANSQPEDYALLDEDKAEAYSDTQKAADLDEFLSAKAETILHGVLGARTGGPRLTGIDAYMRDVVDEFLSQQAAAKKAKMPTGDALKAAREAVIGSTKRGPIVRAEAERRMAQADALKALANEGDE